MHELSTFFIMSHSTKKSVQNGSFTSFQQTIKQTVWKFLSDCWKYLRKVTILLLLLVIKNMGVSSPFQAKKTIRFGWRVLRELLFAKVKQLMLIFIENPEVFSKVMEKRGLHYDNAAPHKADMLLNISRRKELCSFL